MSENADNKDCVCSINNEESSDSNLFLSKIISKFAKKTESELSLRIINRDDESLNSFASLSTNYENFQHVKKIQNENKKSKKIEIDDDNFVNNKMGRNLIIQENKILSNAHKNINIYKTLPQVGWNSISCWIFWKFSFLFYILYK